MKRIAGGLISMLAVLMAFGATEVPPVKMAGEARLELAASSTVGELKEVRILSNEGRLEPLSWASDTDRGKGWVAHFPINQYSWRECALEFVPEKAGAIKLKLTGPIESAEAGKVYRQEVLWDNIAMKPSWLTNGSFEAYFGNRPAGWDGGGVANTGPMPALEGRNYGRTWHGRPLIQEFQAEAGKAIVLTAFARALPVLSSNEMPRIVSRDSLARQVIPYYRHGVNIAGFLEVPPGQTVLSPHTLADFAQIRKEGFDHVRIPIAWHQHTGPAPDFAIDPAFLSQADTVVSNALRCGLFAVINLHGFEEFTANPTAVANKFYAIWRQLARHYAGGHVGIAFELLDEPKDAATTKTMNPIYAQAIKIIRETNPYRTVFLGPGKANSVEELGNLWLPPEEDNVVVVVHCHEPFYFTHQATAWAGPEAKLLNGVVYPGPPPQPVTLPLAAKPGPELKRWLDNYNQLPTDRNPVGDRLIRSILQQAKDWSDFYGRPVYIGEFGCYTTADSESRSRYYRDFRRILEELKLPWAMQDWKGGFRYWDPQKNQPMPGMREAMFPGGS